MCKKTANSLFKDKTNIYVSECLSTNDFLTHLTKKNNLGEGTTVMTDYQVKGKGQRNNMWESKKKKNLLFSLLLKPDIPLSDQFKLHIIISLAIKETLTKLDLRGVKVKWPNDIYINDKKISGILIESQIFNKKIKQVVIGIGLNINQNNFDDLNATSILKETGNESDIKHVRNLLNTAIEKRYLDITKNIEELKLEYIANLYKLNTDQNFANNKNIFIGRIVDVDNDGRIIIKVNGNREKFDFGSVRLL